MRDQLPQRNSPLLFGLTFLSAGLFAPVWVYLMNRDIQKVDASHFPHLNQLALLSSLYPVSLGLHAYATDQGLSSPWIFAVWVAILASWLALVWFFFGGLLAVARYVRKKGAEIPDNVALILLTAVLAFSLPLLQRSLNAVSLNASPRAAPSFVPDA